MNPWLHALQVAVILTILVVAVILATALVCDMREWEDD
ncbi:hypothetical protein SEA_BENCZKOWSKI14_92 [Gordonia phage Benczkowski14]|uniref:Uncharacterized protein n=3 Tax=Demosthenesvirus katyusha TaxID=1982108 RepID=A0A142KCG9_9CAUD|nr:hypothetical protein BH765_gp91 [Gordonia phage Kvothe]YP_009603365.1 hypothetical protein FDH67_gp91 [Gordonia phage Katyusha]AMS03802.1 hypothetical protein SEA_BENCZKOWSKI14_92 [Gordonia phage Benczkowski14]UJD20726.1 membrane protein [Gordonia phage Niagara]AMS03483.1 hypothetical protein SEA_KATYUSHA_90 [Gordonia phage Katyusha]ANA86153.1 hypothetical protein PBI_KVOTHE_91 [Gordonia phage Kvothe]